MRNNLKAYIMIFVGCVIFAAGIAWFADPSGLVTGGISGIAIIVARISQELLGTPVPLSVTNIVLNIPLFIICYRQRGFGFISRSLFSVIVTSVLLEIFQRIGSPVNTSDDILITAVVTGVCYGAGIGIVLRQLATTGGTDMLAAIIKFSRPHFPISALMFIIDLLIILGGVAVFGFNRSVYAVISLLICSKLIDTVLDGFNFAKAIFIISPKNSEISKTVSATLQRGNTLICAKSIYSNETRDILLVVVSSKEVADVKSIINRLDPGAFMIVTDVTEALGEGFKVLEEPKNVL